MSATPPAVAFTIDLEPDCPPFLQGYRGIEEGLPALLELLRELDVPATFFTTGDVAARFPLAVEHLLADGHELGCHGMTHTAFTTMDRETARREIEDSVRILREHAPVTSFRAPYLRFPEEYVQLLESAGFDLDSSQARYKPPYYRRRRASGSSTRIRRIPASVTSSVLRLPKPVRRAYLGLLSTPIVLFVHPWEFVDLRRERLRIDCRFKTGSVALNCVRDVLESYRARGARFLRMRELGQAR